MPLLLICPQAPSPGTLVHTAAQPGCPTCNPQTGCTASLGRRWCPGRRRPRRIRRCTGRSACSGAWSSARGGHQSSVASSQKGGDQGSAYQAFMQGCNSGRWLPSPQCLSAGRCWHIAYNPVHTAHGRRTQSPLEIMQGWSGQEDPAGQGLVRACIINGLLSGVP